MRSIVIEAPSGYGKTTAVEDFLLKILPRETRRVCHHCVRVSPQAAWRGLCMALRTIDERTGTALLNLGLPDEDSAGDAGRLLRATECVDSTWLVLEDFHHMAELAPTSVWKALLDHECQCLRMVLVTQPLAESVMPYEKKGFLRLGVADLRLTAQESKDYFAQAGITLNGEEGEELLRRIDGWMFPLYLHSRHWHEQGGWSPASDLDALLRDVIWNKLDDPSRDFLLRLSPVDHYSLEQATFFLNGQAPPAKAMAALRQNSVLRFDAVSGLYYPHSLLLEFASARFLELPENERRDRLRVAADWCAENGERKKAIALYYQLRDFEKILALDLSGLEDNRLLDLPDAVTARHGGQGAPAKGPPERVRLYADALRDIAAHCDRPMKARHPLSTIQLAFEFFGQGLHHEYASLCEEMASLTDTEVPELERDYLAGELLLMESFRHYNDIGEMGERIRRAARLTGGKTSLISPDNAWTFSNPSVLFMYHREAGRLDAELSDMESYCPHYTAMAKGHGSGGPALMRAEAMLGRGDTASAEIFGHRARHEAAMHDQISVSIGVELFFGRLAILRGDWTAYSHALGSISSLAEEHPQKSNRMEADLARSFLAALLRRPGDAAEWLRHGQPATFSRRLFIQALPFAHVCRASCLLLDRKPEVLIGETLPVLDALAAGPQYALALIYLNINLAAAWAMRGRSEEAESALREALDMALPDALYLPFAEQSDLIGPPLAKALSGEEHAKALSIVKDLARQMGVGRKIIAREKLAQEQPVDGNGGNGQAGESDLTKFHSFAAHYDLTERETEALSYILRKFSVKKMAENMAISDRGVEKHITSIKEKTQVERRRHLPQLYADWKT
jgi:LuxR family maltose regulon positive regulatory protein